MSEKVGKLFRWQEKAVSWCLACIKLPSSNNLHFFGYFCQKYFGKEANFILCNSLCKITKSKKIGEKKPQLVLYYILAFRRRQVNPVEMLNTLLWHIKCSKIMSTCLQLASVGFVLLLWLKKRHVYVASWFFYLVEQHNSR